VELVRLALLTGDRVGKGFDRRARSWQSADRGSGRREKRCSGKEDGYRSRMWQADKEAGRGRFSEKGSTKDEVEPGMTEK